MRVSELLPSRFAMAAGVACAIFVPLAVVASYQWGVTHRDLVREQGRATELYDEIHAPGVGLKDRLTLCGANLAGAQTALARQNKAVEAMAQAALDASAKAQAAVDAAQARAREAQRLAQTLLLEQPRPDETRCQAADRLILENVQ